ncbi:MAG: DNA-methyltransferase [Solirubrobacteraceae bacterium]
MHEPGTALVPDIKPASETDRLERELPKEDLERRFPFDLVSALLGMNQAFIMRALERPGTRPRNLRLAEVIDLLDVDGYQETFVRRSQIPRYLLGLAEAQDEQREVLDGRELDEPLVKQGNARDLLRTLAPGSVQCVVTSSPYWGMRIYENTRALKWADGEHCPYGFEQTPEGFIRHTTELLYLLKPALAADGSVWWNLMDTYNTRTPIRGNARERLDAMGEVPDSRRGWTEHEACRHSAGHMFLADAEQCSIPARVAERASRIGYRLKSYITWTKHSITPESVRSRVTRQAEYVLHLSPTSKAPLFQKDQWQQLAAELGGPNETVESKERVTDVWSLPVSSGKNGHGAEFPLALPGRCIALASREGDVVLDPFLGSGTTALAAVRLNRRCIGFDISARYVQLARKRLGEHSQNEEIRRRPANVSAEQLNMPNPAERDPPEPTAPRAAQASSRRRRAHRLPEAVGVA